MEETPGTPTLGSPTPKIPTLGQGCSHGLTAPLARLGSPGTDPARGRREMLQGLQHGESRAAQYPSHISRSRAFYLSSF